MYAERQRILDVEDGADLAAHLRAVLDADALLWRGRRPRPVDETRITWPLDSRRLTMSQTSRPRDRRHAFSNQPELARAGFNLP